MLDKTGACKALKAAYNTGYQIMPGRENLTIRAKEWTACVRINMVPKEVSAQIVDEVGYIPTICELIRKGRHNQIMLQDELDVVQNTLEEYQTECVEMRRIPIVYRERWQVYLDYAGNVWAYDLNLLAIMDGEPKKEFASSWGLEIWQYGAESVMIAPATFGTDDQRKLESIAELYKNQEGTENMEEVETICLFEPEED